MDEEFFYPMEEHQHFSQPNCLELPCHYPVELISVSSFKVWGNIQSPHCDMAYLLVCLGNTTEERQYGVSLVWVNPHQTRTSTMEEAVEKLATCPSSGADWPYVLAQLYEGSGHVPLPKDKHLGILPQGEAERTSCGWISQLDVCQLLSAGPQVVYPTGLNRHREPIIITLPEPLSSSMSVIASEHPYLEIDIPPNQIPRFCLLARFPSSRQLICTTLPQSRRQYCCRSQPPSRSSSGRSV